MHCEMQCENAANRSRSSCHAPAQLRGSIVGVLFMTKWIIEQFDKSKHIRTGFCCGKPSLDEFLLKLVSQYDKRDLGRTFVAMKPDSPQVIGYYTLAMSSIEFAELPTEYRKLSRHPIPVVLLGR